ncbi:MAG: FAD-dependent oxidoreductase, partial [Pseudomonadota bacterium]
MKSQTSDIAVIGGGVIGLTLARVLRREGASVVVVDASAATDPTAIPAATRAAAGMLAPSFEHGAPQSALDEALYRLGAQGLALWPRFAAGLEDETGVFIDYQGRGALGLAYDEIRADALRAQAEQVNALGGTAQMISGDEARSMEPALSSEVAAAFYAPADAQVDPRRLTTALRASLKMNDATFVCARVTRTQMTSAGGAVMLENGETLEAAKIVIAAGAVSGLVPEDVVFPVKGAALSVASSALTRVVRAPGAYLCPKAEGRLVIGATEEPGRDDLSVD